VLTNGLACLPVVIRLNGTQETSGVLTGVLLLVALAGGALPKILSQLGSRHQAPAATTPPSA